MLSYRFVARNIQRRSGALRMYHQNVVEHYENPRNVGSLDKNDQNVGTVSFYFRFVFSSLIYAVNCIILASHVDSSWNLSEIDGKRLSVLFFTHHSSLMSCLLRLFPNKLIPGPRWCTRLWRCHEDANSIFGRRQNNH
mmetsp:Transcript_14017/g.21394  ORF Transcript_14017/g.21394 Transcript_14017/m.21394 type:complete len:138 (+) Transcript_14017:31-444(+)